MPDKFDVKDFFNYLIAGVFWLLLFWQIDSLWNNGDVFSLFSSSAVFSNEIAVGGLFVVIAFVAGTLLRPLQWIPVCLFNIFVGDPIVWVLKRNTSTQNCIQNSDWEQKANCELNKKLFYFLCLDKTSLYNDEIVRVKRYFHINHGKITDPKKLLNCIKTNLRIQDPKAPQIFDMMDNYQNLVESLMTPVLANAGILIFKRLNIPFWLKCVVSAKEHSCILLGRDALRENRR